MKKTLFLIAISLLFSCTDENLVNDISSLKKEKVIEINTTRSEGNILGVNSEMGIGTKSTNATDPFTEIREVECFESVVLPELQPHIWVGNILTKSSIVDCNYKPLIYPRQPITISTTLPGTNDQIITNPSYSKYLAYVQEQTAKGNFSQNGEFNFTTEQFTSYNELKVAFGSNVSTGALFWKSNTTEEGFDHTISKATGLYVKFYQTSFKIAMDYPQGQIASIPTNLIDEAVYINSITYGRLGILTIETNEAVYTAETIINRTFRKLFVSGSSYLTTEEKAFLDGCDFKVYLIGGNGSTSVETFKGYSAFIQHIKQGTFSRNEPGSPLFCTFNHVRDNSPVSVKFKYSIKKEPVYLELKWRSNPSNDPYIIRNRGDLSVNFYRSRSKIPTIAPPNMKIKLRLTTVETGGGDIDRDPVNKDYVFYNAGYKTSMVLMTNKWTSEFHPARREGSPYDGFKVIPSYTTWHTYFLQDSNEYVALGYNPITDDNVKFAIP